MSLVLVIGHGLWTLQSGGRDSVPTRDTGSRTQSRWPKAKDYIPDENDKMFRQWLNDWRRKTSGDTYGKACVRRIGYSNRMLNSTLELICDAAHKNLIASVDDLYKETNWYLTDEHGQTVVDKIKELTPTAPPSKSHPAPVPKPRRVKCSNCGQVGHTSERFPALCRIYVSVILQSQNGQSSVQSTPRIRLNESRNRAAAQAQHALSVTPRALYSTLNQRPANISHHIQPCINIGCDLGISQTVSSYVVDTVTRRW